MSEVDGGTLVAKALKAEGVKYLFVLWGFHIHHHHPGLRA